MDEKTLVTTLSLLKMAADSELTGASLHLSDIEKNPKEINERGKEASKQPPATSKTEICCKTLAFLIVSCLVCVHLARVIREGKIFSFDRQAGGPRRFILTFKYYPPSTGFIEVKCYSKHLYFNSNKVKYPVC